MTLKEFNTLAKKLIGNREEAVSFWITAALCVVSTALMISNVYNGFTGGANRVCETIGAALSFGIFISAFFALWRPRKDVSPSYKISRQVVCLLALSALIGTLYWKKMIVSIATVTGSFTHLRPFSVAHIFLSPLGMFSDVSRGDIFIFNTLISDLSVPFVLLLFSAGLSWTLHQSAQEKKREDARETLFIHSLQKRLFQSVGLSVLILIATLTLWETLGLWLIFGRQDKLAISFVFTLIETFCPLYTLLMVRKDQAAIDAQLQESPDLSTLKPYKRPEIMLLFLGFLAFLFAFVCLRQIINFFENTPVCDPRVIAYLGVLGIYLYVFTRGIELSPVYTKAINAVRTALPFLYLPSWSIAFYQVVRFAYNQPLTPRQIWIGGILFLIGIFNILQVLKRTPKIQPLIRITIATYLLALIGIRQASFGICEQTIESFLNKTKAFVIENDVRTIRPISNSEAYDIRDLKKIVRAISILEEKAPKRLKTIFGPELEITKNILREGRTVARETDKENQKASQKTESTEVSKTPSLKELLQERPININGKTYKNLSEAPDEVQKMFENVLDKTLPLEFSKTYAFENLAAVLMMLGLEDQIGKTITFPVYGLENWKTLTKKNKKA